MFIGRQRELSLLESAYAASRSAFIPIYGRRRVGKSELILKFMDQKSGIYYLGKTAPAALQMKEFLTEAAHALDEPLLASLAPAGWSELFAAVSRSCKSKQKFIISLDEFQWMVEASPELPSILQEYWDRYWRKAGNIVLILCGSYIGFMEREVLGKKSPLFGRRTAQILLMPFTYLEAVDFHPRWSLINNALAYFICGGMPLYLRFFNQSCSIEKNIEENLLNEFGPLFREPDFLLREELRDIRSYYAVLTAVAAGSATNRLIAAQTGIPERSLHYYIQQLNSLGYIERKLPLTGKKPNMKQVRYVLKDPLLSFWFRFIFPNLSFIQQMGPQRALRDRIRPELDAYFGLCFERLCRQALPVLYQRQQISAAFEIGQYWDKRVQIDVVSVRDDHWTDLGECKWGTIRSYKAVLSDLEKKKKLYPNHRGATIALHLFVKKKPGAKIRNAVEVNWHDLDDLYGRQRMGNT